MTLVSFDDFTEDPIAVYSNPADENVGDARLADDQTFIGHNTFNENVVIEETKSVQVGATGDGEVNWYRSADNIWRTNNDVELTGGDLRVFVGGIQLAEGNPNSTLGRAVLVGGTKVVNTTAVTATSEIFAICNIPGGTPGWLQISARVVGTSFTILSSSGTDTSTVAWVIFEPTP